WLLSRSADPIPLARSGSLKLSLLLQAGIDGQDTSSTAAASLAMHVPCRDGGTSARARVPRSWLQKQLTRAALDKVSWRERPVAHQCRAPAQGARACLVHSRRAGSKAQDEALSDITRVGDASCGRVEECPVANDLQVRMSATSRRLFRGITSKCCVVEPRQ